MLLPLPIMRVQLESGKTAAFAASRGTRVRVVKGRVWATTTGSLDDVWLHAGDEHHLPKGLTVIEASDAPATVELATPANPGPSSTQRMICGIAAVAMTALTLALLVILPAHIDAGSPVLSTLATAGGSLGVR